MVQETALESPLTTRVQRPFRIEIHKPTRESVPVIRFCQHYILTDDLDVQYGPPEPMPFFEKLLTDVAAETITLESGTVLSAVDVAEAVKAFYKKWTDPIIE